MSRSFRFDPPAPRPGSLTRPRLLRALLGRWDHRVTVVIGGPGLGKTTLLAQAVAENLLAPRGEDVWVGLNPSDDDGEGLARDVLAAVTAARTAGSAATTALRRPDDLAPHPTAVAEAVWQQAPTAVCLVVDDTHHLAAGSVGAGWLADLVEVLPDNGHLVLAGRVAPPIPLARLATQGSVLRLVEDDLRFSDDELAGFAARRGIPADRLALTGGWPAMAELAATVSGDLTGDYLWEEVLEPLGPDRRRVLAVVSELGGADDGLASAALGEPVDLARRLDGVPLVAHGADGWRSPHPLWQSVRALALDDDDRQAVRRRAISYLVTTARYDEAMTLAGDAGLDEEQPAILRAACVGPLRPPAPRLDRWLMALPAGARDTPGAALAAGLRAAVATPGEAAAPLRVAIDRCRTAGDPEGELSAIAVLGRVAWWRSDLGLVGELYPRVLELEAEGHAGAGAIAGLGRAIIADLEGDDDRVLGLLDAIGPGVLDPAWESMAAWLRAITLVGRGDAEAAGTVLDTIPPGPDPAFRMTIEGARLMVQWARGRVDEVTTALVPLIDDIRAAGVMQNLTVGLAQAAFVFAWVGSLDAARDFLDQARRIATDAATATNPRLALAEAAVQLAEGDDDAAAAALEAAIGANRLDGMERRLWRSALAMTYVLVPSSRPTWDAVPLSGHLATARRLAAIVALLRDAPTGCDPDEARRAVAALEGIDPATVRTALHYRFAVDLAIGLEAGGRPEGAALLEALGPAGREAVRAVATRPSRAGRQARSLLAAVPAPPRQTIEVNVLGPMELVRDGTVVVDSDLRRERVRALLAYLVGHRTTSRAAIMAALWPDLDERSAANNLRVTMTYLLRLLEPWRSARESSYFIRFDGPNVALVAGDRLRVDLDRFDDHIAQAARADADGVPSEALEHDCAAVQLYRGDLHDGLAEADWFALERERAKGRFVAAATRAGQLLVAQGDPDEAERIARRAVAIDPWAEAAHGVLVSVALARGDRSGARRALDRTLAVVADLGVEPSEETGRLRRRVRSV